MRRSKLTCSKVLLADVLSRKLPRQHGENDRKVLASKARSAPGQKDSTAVDQKKNTITQEESRRPQQDGEKAREEEGKTARL